MTNKERNNFKRIESTLLHLKEQALDILQEDTLKGFELNTNSLPIEELDLELSLYIHEVEEVIFRTDEDDEAAVSTKDEWPKQEASTFPMSHLDSKNGAALKRHPKKNKDFYPFNIVYFQLS